jgi:hypothetical protein
MSDRIRAGIEAYVAAWNEPDPAKRRELLERACADDFRMVTSGRQVRGRAELDAMIADFQLRRPGHRAAFASAIDVQGSVFRYGGKVENATAQSAGDALDAGECDSEGRITLLLTFVGAAPPAQDR